MTCSAVMWGQPAASAANPGPAVMRVATIHLMIRRLARVEPY